VSTLLDIEGLASGYGATTVLEDIALHVNVGEVVAVLGANGAGKTTLLRTVAGLIAPARGNIVFDGEPIGGMSCHAIVGKGLAMVPEGGRLFPFMTVQENLELGAFNPAARAQRRATLDQVIGLFPIVGARRAQLAGSLSGGERQMCAIARALMSGPRMLMLDEPSAGLSPLMVERVFDLIRSIVSAGQVTILLVEQHIEDALEIAHRAYVIERGRVVKTGAGSALAKDPDIQRVYMGL
jgi:branched-chain amino acid transport system ATP-binding protein